MTKYHVITLKQYGDQHCEDPNTHLELVPLERAIADLGYVHPDISEDKLQIYIAQARVDQLEAERDQARQARDMHAGYRDEARKERDKARRSSDDYEQRWHSVQKQRDTAMQERDEALQLVADAKDQAAIRTKAIAKLHAQLDDILAAPPKRSCLSCGSTDYVWYFDNGESAYCSKCSPDTPPPPAPSLKYALCPGCNRLLTTLGDGLTGTCCLCGAELSPPVCPHCGHDTFELVRPFTVGTFNADGTLALPGLYFFVCAKCGKEVGTLPLKRTDK